MGKNLWFGTSGKVKSSQPRLSGQLFFLLIIIDGQRYDIIVWF
jgi:hypothetical protein